MTRLAVIGGSGFSALPGLEVERREPVPTPYGETSAPLTWGRLGDCPLLFLPRHGDAHGIPPHQINYRANIRALADAGASHIVGLGAVGGIAADCAPGVLCVPDQIIDYTWARLGSFYQGEPGDPPLDHIDFTEPYCTELRAALLASAEAVGQSVRAQGCYGATQGPRLETAAEIRRMARDGCDLVGMTGMPEAALARELGLCYAALCFVVNPAPGCSDGPVTMDEINANLGLCAAAVEGLLQTLAQRWVLHRERGNA
ncbi:MULTISPECIES: S-methyl-5'-thioinosine phosphorylase [Thiorhodovibrio]|uniref:S-methyl-5'-thioinosine phosphorylase n=1 Tax=Thiorhodovibrio TaxID=61593 RepID=UPI0019149EA5|nr:MULTISPECIES: S-methyl-5'-thioinosine phosphorylase [Thiorhodovibrio]MBK5967842.1 5'-methylthioadenosine phosphorylase [Thiorhodovibrio winogradskyi]WPL11149.1 S-methyl-5'-thioinosine phosphorylase [Thiorhodovibrio litoralis]